MPVRRHLIAGVSAAAIGASAGPLSGAARADDAFAVSPSIRLAVKVGPDGPSFGLGIDVRATYSFDVTSDACSGDPTEATGLGVFAGGMVFLDGTVRATAGLHAGRGDEDLTAWAVDLGWTYDTGRSWQPSTHGFLIGGVLDYSLLDAALALTLDMGDEGLRPGVIAGVGVRYPTLFGVGLGHCDIGRPFRADGGACLPGVIAVGRHVGPRPRVDAHARQEIASAWLDAAQSEAASVPSFFALAQDLRRARAPRPLVARALRSARQEARHARMCLDIAGRYAGARFATTPQVARTRPAHSRAEALRRLAVEAWHDGCLGEGTSAASARRALHHVRAEDAGAALTVIARDEAGHAELAWDTLRYAVAEGGRPVREALAEAVDAVRQVGPSGPQAKVAAADPVQTAGAGCVAGAVQERAWVETHDRARRRVDRLLASRPASRT